MNYHDYKSCIDACLQCAAVCHHCASMDLQEDDPEMMSHCAQLNMDCAAVCIAAAQLMSIGSKSSKKICQLCAEICKQCMNECVKHDNEHCIECAQTCQTCIEECENI